MLVFLIIIIILALIFDYINGFHDAANSIATIVSTKVLTPFQAVIWAAAFNFIAFFIFREHKVAGTIANIVSENIINFKVLVSATLAAISWNLLTWYYGIPSSSSHTLIGGLAGAALAAGGLTGVNTHPVFIALIFMVFAPVIGLIFGFLITVITVNLAKKSRPSKADRWFRRLQLVSSAALSLAHGGGDSQKTMGLILTAIWFYEKTVHGNTSTIHEFAMPGWLPLACYSAIALGHYVWRLAYCKNNGYPHYKGKSPGRCMCRNSRCIHYISYNRIWHPGKYHTYTYRINCRRWRYKTFVCRTLGCYFNLLWAWILTIPVSALVAAAVYYVIHFFYTPVIIY